MCKAPVKSSPSTNQHPAFYRPDALPVTQPTVTCQSTEGRFCVMDLYHYVTTGVVGSSTGRVGNSSIMQRDFYKLDMVSASRQMHKSFETENLPH